MYYVISKIYDPAVLAEQYVFTDETLAAFRQMVDAKHHVAQRANAALRMLNSAEELVEHGIIEVTEDLDRLHVICDPMLAALSTVILAVNKNSHGNYIGTVRHLVETGASDIEIDINSIELDFTADVEDSIRKLFMTYISNSREEYKQLLECPEIAIGLKAHPINLSELRLEDL